MPSLNDCIARDASALEEAFLHSLKMGDTSDVAARYEDFLARAVAALEAGQLSAHTARHLSQVASRISVVAHGLNALEAAIGEVQRDFRQHTRELCEQWRLAPTSCSSSCAPDAREDDPAAFAPYRRWFLEHLANPYPSPKDKEALLKQVERHNKTQLDTWFVNIRRRSGWQALKRAHTNGSVEDMVRLLCAVETGAPEVGDDVRREVERVRAFFNEGTRDKVSDEIQAIVRQRVLAPPLPPVERPRRRLDQRAARGVGGSASAAGGGHAAARRGASALSTSRSCRARTPPLVTRPSGVYATSPSETSPIEMSPLAAFGNAPRYPSTFSSPASSARTVSDSSSASFDSLVTYASAESEYYETPVASSPPATSSLLSFAGSGPSSSAHLPPPAPPTFFPRAGRAAPYALPSSRPHPYFCTVDELPTSTSLAGFATR